MHIRGFRFLALQENHLPLIIHNIIAQRLFGFKIMRLNL